MNGIGDDLKQQWLTAVADFQAQRMALNDAEQALYGVFDNIIAGDATDAAEWGKNLEKVKNQQAIMDNVAGAVATVADYWNRATNYVSDLSHDNVIYDAGNAVLQTVTGNPYDSIGTAIYGWFNSSGLNGIPARMRANGALGGLGLAPVVLPITLGALALIIGGAAAVVASVTAYITYVNTKKDRVQQLIDAGVDPVTATQTATEEAKATSGYTFGASLQKMALYGVIAAAVVVFGPKLAGK